MLENQYRIGIDAGSTTLKLVVVDSSGDVVYKDYQRHHADVLNTLIYSLSLMRKKLGEVKVSIKVTGSAGMGLSERYDFSFIQEVVSATKVIEVKYPSVKTLIDIGGEDSKMIFFGKNMQPDIRMNGNCAGGTGAFLDQMAAILNLSVSELSDLAEKSTTIYPIASRCGVFSKTDIQNLIALNVKREDIASSIFNAVITQVISTLSRGCDIAPQLFLCGGPFAHIPYLYKILKEKLSLTESDIILSDHASVVPAWGAALSIKGTDDVQDISDVITSLETKQTQRYSLKNGLAPLFKDSEELNLWRKKKAETQIEKISIESVKDGICYIGIDSGSTTTKIVATDREDRIFFTFYKKSAGKPLETVKEGLTLLLNEARGKGISLKVAGSCSTGYGEDLVKTAFGLNHGMVETIAHYTAAYKLNPNVSFILDIGGQDMKAIFVENGCINRLEINEACSSGCGSFLDSFAQSLNCPIEEFVEKACQSSNPSDLGTRCTVFMNSKVKQSLREGAPLADISAGLAYSVVKNCLYKVLKIKDMSEMGNHIVLQGGTMRNSAVVRAFELSTQQDVIVSNIPELMGAYGAALFAKKRNAQHSVDIVSLELLVDLKEYQTEPFRCVGCENNCQILKNTFSNDKVYYSGNKCEKVYTNKGKNGRVAFNLSFYKNEMSFKKNLKGKLSEPYMTIGVPRALNMYDNFQFWYHLFILNNIEVKTSSRSTFTLYEKGLNTVMADNICFPAKLLHGHIFDLMSKKVDRIFFPYVVYEKLEKGAQNSFNCPIVAGYSDVIQSAINTHKRSNIPLDAPVINFKDIKLLERSCSSYIKSILGKKFDKKRFKEAFSQALMASDTFATKMSDRANSLLNKAKEENRFVILLAGRPYHNDPLIQHKVSEIITSFGVDVVTEDIVRYEELGQSDSHIIKQWSYVNRIVRAAEWVASTKENVHYVQLTSFGCGPDAFILDEVSDILKRGGKNLTLLKVDDVNNVGSLRLRIRSLVESLSFKNNESDSQKLGSFVTTPEFLRADKKRKILVPYFSEFHSPYIPTIFKMMGYNFENLPPSDALSSQLGLQYANNEVCYPATLVIGDYIKALQSGKYDKNEIALAITQTGGQCRATNYIALIKKALIAAGYGDVPVISISIMNTINKQSGFSPNLKKIAIITTYLIFFADALSKIYYSAVVREKEKGLADCLRDEYITRSISFVEARDRKGLVKLLAEAAKAFDSIIERKKVLQVGIVGEIFIKYNHYGQQNVVNWFVQNGIEPVIPPLNEFFLQYFPNAKYNESSNLEEKRNFKSRLLSSLGETLLNRIIKSIDKAASNYSYYSKMSNMNHEAEKASRIVNLAAQFGEGWLIPAEIASFAENGVNAVVSLQPFGCIANHVISKGIEKKIKDIYPDMNILYLDFDGGVSEVNVLNRLHFIARSPAK